MGNFYPADGSYSLPDPRVAELLSPAVVYVHRNTSICQGSDVMTREGA